MSTENRGTGLPSPRITAALFISVRHNHQGGGQKPTIKSRLFGELRRGQTLEMWIDQYKSLSLNDLCRFLIHGGSGQAAPPHTLAAACAPAYATGSGNHVTG